MSLKRILLAQFGQAHSMPEPIASVEHAFDQIAIPQGQRFVSVSKAEGRFIHKWICEHQLSNTLEIGLGYGASAACIMSAHSGPHSCIDPYQYKDYQNIGLNNLEKLGYQNRLTFYQDFSHNVLPKLHAERQKFDFVFIDGDHRFDSIFVDFYYADLLLAEGGYLLFHDAWMRGTQLIASYIRRNRSNYKMIHWVGLNLLLFQKSGKSRTSWDDFKEFYTLRGLISHSVVRLIIRLFAR
jgi:predicted O-methyltransferase YrrM